MRQAAIQLLVSLDNDDVATRQNALSRARDKTHRPLLIVHEPGVMREQLPQPVIRPYPAQYIGAWTTRAGVAVMIRPIRPEDEPLMVAFHQEPSERSVFFRYLAPIALSQRVAHERLTRMCFIDYDREIALVVEAHDPATRARAILAVGRLIKLHSEPVGEFAILVADRFQRQGLGTELLRRLVQIGRAELSTPAC